MFGDGREDVDNGLRVVASGDLQGGLVESEGLGSDFAEGAAELGNFFLEWYLGGVRHPHQ
jgi:hypothetical protein